MSVYYIQYGSEIFYLFHLALSYVLGYTDSALHYYEKET